MFIHFFNLLPDFLDLLVGHDKFMILFAPYLLLLSFEV